MDHFSTSSSRLGAGSGRSRALVKSAARAFREVVKVGLYHRRRRRVQHAGAMQLVPPQTATVDGAGQRLDDDEIHELSVHDLLTRQGPQRAQAFAVERERIPGTDG